MAVRSAEALLERGNELDQIAALLEAVPDRRGGVLVIEGPAGIGKTSLAAAAATMARERELAVFRARGGELERDFAFGVVRQLFETPVAGLSKRERATLFEGAAVHARPVLDPDEAGGDPPESAFAVLHGLFWVCAGLAERGPGALVIDDLHWADAASLRFLAYLARRIEGLPLAVIGAARPATIPEHAELIAALVEGEPARRIEPTPLGEESVAAIVRATLGAETDEELCRACHEATGGNPFLTDILASALAAGDRLPDRAAVRRVSELASRTVSRVVVQRLGRLSAPATALAQAVAILGTDADLLHAARLADLEPEDAAVAADALAAQEILRVGRPLEFVHPLVRAAVRDEMAPAERALAHGRAGRMLTEQGVRPDRVAVHLLAAEPTGDPWVVETLRAAAAAAGSQGAPDAAAAYLRRALAEPPTAEVRGAVLREAGAAEVRAAQPDLAAEHLTEALERIDSPQERAAIAHDLATGLIAPGRYAEATQMLERAVEEAARVDRDLALGLEAELIVSATMEPQTYHLTTRRLEGISQELRGETPGERAFMVNVAWDAAIRGEDRERAIEYVEVAVERGLMADRPCDSGLVMNSVFTPIMTECFDRAEATSNTGLADVRARGSVVGYARHMCFRSILEHRRGRLADAEGAARAAIEAGGQAGYRVALMARAMLVDALRERGALEEADLVLRDAGLEGPIPETFMLNFLLESRGWLRLAQGRPPDAAADFEELGRRGSRWCPWNPAMFAYRSGLALALHATGDRDRPQALVGDELERSRSWGAPRTIGISLRTLGLVTGGEDGLALLRESVETLEPSPARLELARSLVDLGAAIRRSGLRAESREVLHRGMDLAHRCGAAPLVERARVELRATGARPRRVMRTGVDALTPSELRVARMAADGMTNREIAQALFVTLRTVEVHLTHSYQKLDISSREELAAALVAES